MIAERAVEPLAVKKDFDPFEDRGAGLRSPGEVSPMHQFAFEAAPEASIRAQLPRGIRVVYQSTRRSPMGERQLQRRQRQARDQALCSSHRRVCQSMRPAA